MAEIRHIDVLASASSTVREEAPPFPVQLEFGEQVVGVETIVPPIVGATFFRIWIVKTF